MDTITGHRPPRPERTPTRRAKAAIVLEALHADLSVDVGGYRLRMSDDHQVIIEAQAYTIDYRTHEHIQQPHRHLPHDLPLNAFLRECETLSDEDTFLLAANVAMNR